MVNIFEQSGVNKFIERINKLESNSKALWGKMNVSQMLVHCSYAFEDNTPKARWFEKLLIKLFRRKTVIGDRPYKQNMITAKAFQITGSYDFEEQKERLIRGINRIQQLGFEHFDGKEHGIFGKLDGHTWNNFFTKHLDHHLRQFGV